MRSPPSRPRRSSGEPSRSTIPSVPDTWRQPSGGSSGETTDPMARAALSSTGPPRKNTPGGLTTSRHWSSTSSTGVSDGWLRITPRLPSSLDSRMTSTQRAKLGSTNVAEAISREPAAGCMPPWWHLTPCRSAPAGHECGGHGGQALAATGQAEPVGGGGADRDVDAVPLGDASLGLLAARSEAGDVADQLAGHVADLPPGGAQAGQCLGQEVVAGGAGPLRVRRTEVAAEVPEGSCREQGVADGVQHDVAVRVALEPELLVGQ